MKKFLLSFLLCLLIFSSASAQPGACGSGSSRFIIPLDAASVTVGGTAVNALKAGNARCGGWIVTSATAGICVDQTTSAGTATGTPSTTACVGQNVPFYLVPSANAVSVNSTGSSVALGGEGVN